MQNVRPWPKASVEKPWLDSASVFCYPWRKRTTSLKNCTAVMPALWCPAVPSNNAIAYSQAPPFSLDVRQIRYPKTTKLPNLKIGFRQCILCPYAHYDIKVWGQWIWLLGKQHTTSVFLVEQEEPLRWNTLQSIISKKTYSDVSGPEN